VECKRNTKGTHVDGSHRKRRKRGQSINYLPRQEVRRPVFVVRNGSARQPISHHDLVDGKGGIKVRKDGGESKAREIEYGTKYFNEGY